MTNQSPHPSLKKKFAFTLAEVLITLGIIGIVAAMTLPTVVNKIEKQKNLTVLQRAYSDLAKYVSSFNHDYSCDGNLINCVPNTNEFSQKFIDYLISKQKFQQIAKSVIYVNDFNGTMSSHLAATNNWTKDGSGYSALLISPTGAYMYYITVHQSDLDYHVRNNKFRAWVWIFTDNGNFYRDCQNCSAQEQAKARVGRNMFQAFVMDDQRIIPNGSSYCAGGEYHCLGWVNHGTCKAGYEHAQGTHNRNMWGCLGRIIDKGWRIDYY